MTREVGQGSGSSERMGGYDQFSSLLSYILHIIYVHLYCFVCSSVLSYHNMLYLSVIIHEPCLYTYYIYMIHMLYVLLIHIGMDQFEIMISMVKYLLYVIIIMLIYRIKII
jgi:hypothetical protein